ncbi:MAG: hypothetical protein Q4D58_03655 [Synergistaceae bacterium]|nr:hypothetical protein [Synergistaceae bacterium]
MIEKLLLLTLFDSLYPCWTEEMLVKEGVDIPAVASLVEEGLVVLEDGVYSLSESGRKEFGRIALENFIEEKPGRAPRDRARSAKSGALLKLLDGAHQQRWGIKQYYTSPELAIFPAVLSDGELFRVEGDSLTWPYMESEAYRRMTERFIPSGLRGRNQRMAAEAEAGAGWLEENRQLTGCFIPDILYVCRYDYLQYEDFKGHPNDPMRLVNTDRFVFVHDSSSEAEELRDISAFRRWITLQRLVLLPDFFDIDTQEQDSICQLLFVSEREEEAAARAARLSRFGAALTAGAEPFEIWTMSVEALAAVTEKRELIWELLPDIAHPVRRMAASAG